MTEDPRITALRAARRLLAVQEAREDMAAFMHLMMPDPRDPDDAKRSLYQRTPQGDLLCDLIRQVDLGDKKRVGVSVPPQHGKTIHLSTYGPAWIWGRNPRARLVVATYNEDRAAELGDDFKAVIDHPAFAQVFPDFELSTGSKSKTAMRTTAGGKLFFVGAGSGTTGKSADVFIVDDPIKDDIQVQSDDFREKLWKWFFSVAYSRGDKNTRMIVLHTRWHEDDLLGRLCDPNHPERKKTLNGIADDWDYLNVPGVITDEALADTLGLSLRVPANPRVIEQFGTKPMSALWEENKDLSFFSQWKRGDRRSFGALVMGEPTPEDGEFFKAEWLMEYNAEELPRNLRWYGASDHAVSTKQERDPSVLGDVGVDEDGDIWVMPELVWDRFDTKQTVDELIAAFRRRPHMTWWMEDELISKSFGPFLRERMRAEGVYTLITPVRPSHDKQTRARSIQGRMSLQTVHFPRFAPWWADARAQLLRFPYAAHDDFVDWIAHIGNGLNSIITAEGAEARGAENVIEVGSPVWTLRQARRRAMNENREAVNYGW